MTVKAIPEGYHSVQPYLILNEAAKAMEFYKKAFGASERLRMEHEGRIGHAELEIGDSCVMLADEAPERKVYGVKHFGGCPITLLIYTENCDAMYKQALAAGATSVQEPVDRFYGDRSCGVKDPFGYTWYISTHIKDMTQEELEQAHKNQK